MHIKNNNRMPLLLFLIFLFGCTPTYMEDMVENQYFTKQVYANPDAPYIGEWTAAVLGGIYSIKINERGYVISCSKNEYLGQGEGKIFQENGKIKIIYESGSQEEIVSVKDNVLVTDSYGNKITYYLGKTPDRCRAIFAVPR